jgi:Gpi18-like mannosyltransferase
VKVPFGKREFSIVAALLILAFIIRIALFPIPGYKNDSGTFAFWFNTAAASGPRVFYDVVYKVAPWTDYPPLNVYIFWIFGSLSSLLSKLFSTDLIMYMTKLPSNLFDMGTAILIFAFVRKRLTLKMALLAAALYAFNPAVIFNTAVWGQFDAIYTFFLVLSLYLIVESKPKWATVAFIFGILTKPQSIALAPLFVFLIFKKYNWKGFISSVIVSIIAVFAVIIPFQWSNPVTFLTRIYFGAYGNYAVTSANAFNIWSFGGLWQTDTQITFLLGWTMFASLAAFTLYVVNKRFKANQEMLIFLAAFVLFFGFFMFPTRIHERYLFPAMAILALMFPFLKGMRPMYIVLTATCFINQAYVLYWLNVYANAGYSYGPNLSGDPVVLAVSLINLIAFVYILVLMFGELRGRTWLSPPSNSAKTPIVEVKKEET